MDGRSRSLRATVLFHYHSILQRRVVCGTAQTRRNISARVSNALHSRPMPEDAFFESVSRMPETIQHMKFSAGHDGKLHSRWGLLAVLHTSFIFTTFHLQALGCHLGLILLRFWRVLGSFFRDFGPLGRRNAGTDFELKTQAIPVAVQNEFMQF